MHGTELIFPSSFVPQCWLQILIQGCHYLSNPSNYPSNILCCVNKQTTKSVSQVKLNANPPEINTKSLLKPSPDRSSSLPTRGQSNGVGIIGGVSVDSTLNFTEKIVQLQSKDEGNGPTFVLCSDPALSIRLSSTERSDHSSVVENLRRKRVFLEKSGVGCIAMPCHVLHSWSDEIEEGCSVPFLHVRECVAKAKPRPIEAGSPPHIGVLSTDRTLAPRFYREKLENQGFEVILPDKATMENAVIPAVEALNRKDYEGAQNLFRIALQVLLVRAVNRVIIASDELQHLLPPDDLLRRKCVDPMDALARSSMKIVRSAETGK